MQEVEWHKRRMPEANHRPARLPLAKGEAHFHFVIDDFMDHKIVAQIHTPPMLIRGRVIAVDVDAEQGAHVVHVGLAISGMASWPGFWRFDASRITYEQGFRILETPGATLSNGLARLWHSSERLHIHLLSRWRMDDERLPLLRRGRQVEIYGPIATLLRLSGACEVLFTELDPPECWCVYPLSITPA